MSFKKAAYVFILSLISHCVFSQYNISGFAYDAIGNRIVNANVEIKGANLKKSIKTNEEGSYSFYNVANGSYELRLTADKVTETVSVNVNNNDVDLDLFLFSLNNEAMLNEMVIQFESAKSEIEKSGFAASVIETKEAALRNIQTNELLDRTVGVRVRQNGGLGASVDYNLNGLSGNAIKIFIDGLPISTYGPSFNLNSIPPALIERIEVYKGVVPVYLSDDALGGAINVVLKKGLRNNLNASVSYGSFNTFQSNFGASFRRDSGFTIKTSGFYNYSDNDYEVWGKFVKNTLPNGRLERVRAKRFNDAYKSYGGQIEAGFTDVSWADQFFIGFNASDSYNEIQHGTYMTKPYKGRFTTADNQVVSLNYKKKDFIFKNLDLNLTGNYSKRNEIVNDTVKWNYNWFGDKNLDLDGNPILSPTGAQQGVATILNSKREIYTMRGNLSYEFLENQYIIFNHLYYSFDRIDDDELRSPAERLYNQNRNLLKNISSFAYEARWLNNRLKTNFFTKNYNQKIKKVVPNFKTVNNEKVVEFETMNNQFSYLGYGGAASYLLRPAIVILASAEEAVRMPSEAETFGEVGENIVENNSLRPEVSSNYNLGFKIGPYKYISHKIAFSGSVFLRDTKDKIVRRSNTRINDAEQVAPFENLSKTKTKGFELELNYSYKDRLNILVNASRFNTVYNKKYDANGNVFGYYNQQLPNEPFFTMSGSAQYSVPNLIAKNSVLNIYYSFNLIQGFYTNWLEIEDFKTPNQFIQDIGINYIFPNRQFVVSFDAKNIFNKEAYDNFAVQKPGRAFYIKLNYTFNKF